MATALAGTTEDPAREPSAAEFEAFDRFPWSKHRAFLAGLIETLGGVDSLVPSPTHEGSCAFCRTVVFRMQTGRRVDLTRYNQFRAAHPAYPSIDQRLLAQLYTVAGTLETPAASDGREALPSNPLATDTTAKADRSRLVVEAVARGPVLNAFDGTMTATTATETARNEKDSSSSSSSSSSSIPSWMRSAPKAPLHVDRASLRGAASAGEAPHSDKLAKIIEAIQTGQPVEGIQQIPDTVVRRAGITPVGKLKARRKPWEVAVAAGAGEAADAEGGEAADRTAGVTSILSVLSLETEGQKQESGQQQQQTTVLEFPPLPEESSLEAEPEEAAAATD